jgi:hypothetical protein
VRCHGFGITEQSRVQFPLASKIFCKSLCHNKKYIFRLTTVKKADRIIVLDGGLIVEEGTYDQLISNLDGRFHKMYMDQRLDALKDVFPQKPTISGKMSVGPFDRPDMALV